MNDFIKSRRFWAVVASIIVVVFRDKLSQFGITEDQVSTIVMAIGAWIVGESIRSSQWQGPVVGPAVVDSHKEPKDAA